MRYFNIEKENIFYQIFAIGTWRNIFEDWETIYLGKVIEYVNLA